MGYVNIKKFRTWTGKKIIEPDRITKDCRAWWRETETEFPLSSDIVMQFTGILDKNNREIYEGDIVKLKYPNAIHEVFYELERPWSLNTHGFYPFTRYDLDDSQVDVEVIGNIYENPELKK